MKTMTHGVRATQRYSLNVKSMGNGKSIDGSNPDGGSLVPTPAAAEAPSVTDEQLLMAYRGGDRKSFTDLMGRYQRELFHFLVRFLGDRAAAEDIFQETFLQIHQSAQDFDSQRRFRPWLFTIAANKARDLMRSNARRPTSPLQANINQGENEGAEFIDLLTSPVDLPDQPMQQRELQEKVQKTVESMPENLREILLLSYFHQFPYKQISAILDIPLGTVKSRLHAAVAHFANQWRASNPGQSLS
jgi:RNA polymerase sigma-70 factor, ECF subfamily